MNDVQIRVLATTKSGNPSITRDQPTILAGLKYSNINYLAARAGSLRINSAELVITNTQPSIYSGGVIQCGKVVSPHPPKSQWVNYLYSLNKKYMGNLKHGLHNLWIANAGQWSMATPQAISLNQSPNLGSAYHSNQRFINPFMRNSTVFLTAMDYVNPVTSSPVPSLPLEFKVNAWVDYTTSDTSVGTVPGIVFTDKWLTAVSILAAAYVITDNPAHLNLKKKLKSFVSFLTSDDPRASAIRAGGAHAAKALATFAPLITAMLV
jgi:hypothetical protein